VRDLIGQIRADLTEGAACSHDRLIVRNDDSPVAVDRDDIGTHVMAAQHDGNLVAGSQHVRILDIADLGNGHLRSHAERVVAELLQRLACALGIENLEAGGRRKDGRGRRESLRNRGHVRGHRQGHRRRYGGGGARRSESTQNGLNGTGGRKRLRLRGTKPEQQSATQKARSQYGDASPNPAKRHELCIPPDGAAPFVDQTLCPIFTLVV